MNFSFFGRVLIVSSALGLFPGQAFAAKAPYIGSSLIEKPCNSYRGTSQGFGPFDYRKYEPTDRSLKLVNKYHFNKKVENLQDGLNNPTPIGDINYTLNAFPNHHRALYAAIRLYTTTAGKQWSERNQYREFPPPECYLQRAGNFLTDDAHIPLLYGIYLHRLDKTEKAIEKYRSALEKEPRFPEAWYNLGLALYDLERFKEAQQAAKKAYSQGFPLPGLREKLASSGYSID